MQIINPISQLFHFIIRKAVGSNWNVPGEFHQNIAVHHQPMNGMMDKNYNRHSLRKTAWHSEGTWVYYILYYQAYNKMEFEKLDLSSKEMNDIISFMKTLTDTTHKPAARLQ